MSKAHIASAGEMVSQDVAPILARLADVDGATLERRSSSSVSSCVEYFGSATRSGSTLQMVCSSG
jgi:hypothetical protein